MDWQSIISIIGSVGFPIFACIYMFKYMQKLNENHKAEIDELTKAVNNNTVVITRLYEKTGGTDEKHTRE